MESEKAKISNSQLLYLIIGMIQGSTLTLAYIYRITRQDTWIIIITGFIVTLPFALVYVSLSEKFPGKNLMEINEKVYGSLISRFISIIYIGYYFLIVSYNLRFMGDFLTNYIFEETPIIVFIIVFTLLCSWAVRNGIEVIARCSPILVIITFFVAIVTILLLLNRFKFSNLLPIFELNTKEVLQSTHIMFAIPFGEVIAFLMINSSINDVKQLKRTTVLGLSISTIYFLLAAITSTVVLGILNLIQVSPSYQAVRSISVADILTRFESLITMVLLITIFIKICIFYYASVLGIAGLLKMRTYKPLITPLGIISISLSILIYDNSLEIGVVAASVYPIIAMPVQVFIPIITLILARMQRIPIE